MCERQDWNRAGAAVTVEDDRIVIRTDVEPFGEDAASRQGNDVVPVTVELDDPLGQRALIDGACLEGEAVETAPCIRRCRPVGALRVGLRAS